MSNFFSFSKSRRFSKFVVLTTYASKVVLNIFFLILWKGVGFCSYFLGDSIIDCVMKISSQNWFEKMDQYYLQIFVHFLYLR